MNVGLYIKTKIRKISLSKFECKVLKLEYSERQHTEKLL